MTDAMFSSDQRMIAAIGSQRVCPRGVNAYSTDCARAAAGALAGRLTDTGPVDVTGPEALSFAEVAQRLSHISGRTIPAHALPDNEIIAQVVAKGTPAGTVSFMVGMVSRLAHSMSITPTDTVERASGTKPSPVDVVLGDTV